MLKFEELYIVKSLEELVNKTRQDGSFRKIIVALSKRLQRKYTYLYSNFNKAENLEFASPNSFESPWREGAILQQFKEKGKVFYRLNKDFFVIIHEEINPSVIIDDALKKRLSNQKEDYNLSCTFAGHLKTVVQKFFLEFDPEADYENMAKQGSARAIRMFLEMNSPDKEDFYLLFLKDIYDEVYELYTGYFQANIKRDYKADEIDALVKKFDKIRKFEHEGEPFYITKGDQLGVRINDIHCALFNRFENISIPTEPSTLTKEDDFNFNYVKIKQVTAFSIASNIKWALTDVLESKFDEYYKKVKSN